MRPAPGRRPAGVGGQVHGGEYAQATTANAPVMTDIGFSQLVIASPGAIPGGTRPDATPPAAAPRKNGVTTDEDANAAPNSRAPRAVDGLAERERRAAAR